MSYEHIPDLRSYAYHQKAAEKLMEDPDLLDKAYEILYHWAQMDGKQSQLWAFKWISLIEDLNASEVASLITTQNEEFDFYRKTSPFSCLLSQEERLEIINTYRYDYE